MNHIFSNHPGMIIFDVDGTLYDQGRLRRIMTRKLLLRLLSFRLSLKDLRIVSCFRKEREMRKGYRSANLGAEQYSWCADKLMLPEEKIRKTIEYTMHKMPLAVMDKVRYAGVDKFFAALREKMIKIVIYSDYPAAEKMKAMGLPYDACYCSSDKGVDQLKPASRVLKMICSHMNVSPENSLYIGDREEVDGEGARGAGIPYINIDHRKARKGFYHTLTREIQLL
jgi:HAD superfamily hydrolase (TIGR01549 family)